MDEGRRLVLFGEKLDAQRTALGVIERRRGGQLTQVVTGFFPVEGPNDTRIELVSPDVLVHLDERPDRAWLISVEATLVHAALRSSPTQVFFPTTQDLEPGMAGYRRDLAKLRKKVESRLRRIARAMAEGEQGFFAHDAWPES